MPSNRSLSGEQIVLTGTKMPSAIQQQIESFGGDAIHLPLIEVIERTTEDAVKLPASMDADWLIFTSQSAVHFLQLKMIRYGYTAENWHGKVAAVGEKTAEQLKKLGFHIDFIPTIYSADVFIQEFELKSDETCTFFRGNLAKSTIPDGLNGCVECYTVYDTMQTAKHMPQINELLSDRVTIVFASPSAVAVFEQHKAEKVYNVAAIGHITRDALEAYGEQQIVMPATYTLSAVIEELVK